MNGYDKIKGLQFTDLGLLESDLGTCQATRIGVKTILTAAHCVAVRERQKSGEAQLRRAAWVTFKIFDPNDEKKVRTFIGTQILLPSEYSGEWRDINDWKFIDADIAMIQLDLTGVNLPVPRWTATETFGAQQSHLKLASSLFHISGRRKDTVQLHLNVADVAPLKEWPNGNAMTSVKYPSQAACRGDSGGPIVELTGETLIIRGIVSAISYVDEHDQRLRMASGYDMCGSGQNINVTSISHYSKWIKQTLLITEQNYWY